MVGNSELSQMNTYINAILHVKYYLTFKAIKKVKEKTMKYTASILLRMKKHDSSVSFSFIQKIVFPYA